MGIVLPHLVERTATGPSPVSLTWSAVIPVRVGFHIYWFLVGFAVAAVMAAAFQPESAAAQGLTRLGVAQAQAPAARGRSPGANGQQPAAPSLRGSQQPAAEEQLPEADPDTAEDGDAAARVEALADEINETNSADNAQAMRGSVQDGDPSFPGEQQDGVLDVEAAVPQDGANPARVDMRSSEDIAALENPPAGYDPLLFQIEDIDPVRNRRIDRLYKFEPYDPAGIKAGGFVIFPEIEVVGVAQRNVLRGPKDSPDVALGLRPSIRAVSDWRRHAVEFRASGNVSAHDAHASEDDRAYHLEMRSRVDVFARTNVQVETLRDVSQEGRQVLEASRTASRADITLDSTQATLNHRFNRLALQLRGGVSDFEYGAVRLGSAEQSNADRNYKRTTEAVRVTWEFKPTLAAFAEVGLDQRSYGTAAFSDSILRSSNGERYRFGVSFGSVGAYLRGEASAGWGEQSPKDKRLKDVSGIIIDANVAWKVTGLTTVSFKAASDFQESNIAGTAGSILRSGGAEVRHAFRPWLIATAGLTYTATDYSGVPLNTRELAENIGLEYYLNREWTAQARYKHTDYTTNALNGNYNDDEVRVGLRWRR